jgi:type II secretory pathway predicted ATPase ExeA
MIAFPIIPRETEQEKLLANITQRQATLLLGDIGMGKTVLLKQVAQQLEVAIYVDTVSPIKSALLEILHALHHNGDLHLEGIQTEYLPWEELEKKLSRQTIKTLLTLAQQNIKGKGYVLFLDALETATPTMAKRIEALMEQATVIGAANRKHPGLKPLWWRFETMNLPPLTEKESQRLLWTLLDKEDVSDAALLERIVLNQANGNPLVITQLALKAKKDAALTKDSIRALRHEAGVRFVDMTPLFFLVGTVAIAARFFALGINSIDLYLLAGVCGGVFMGLRYFVYRAMRGGE